MLRAEFCLGYKRSFSLAESGKSGDFQKQFIFFEVLLGSFTKNNKTSMSLTIIFDLASLENGHVSLPKH